MLSSAHPSPLSAYRGFFGSKPFSKANAFLEKNGLIPIDWSQITDFRNEAPYYRAKGKIIRV